MHSSHCCILNSACVLSFLCSFVVLGFVHIPSSVVEGIRQGRERFVQHNLHGIELVQASSKTLLTHVAHLMHFSVSNHQG